MEISMKDLELALEEIRRNYGDIKIQFSEDKLERVAGGKNGLSKASAALLASLSAICSTGVSGMHFSSESSAVGSSKVSMLKNKIKNLNPDDLKKFLIPIAIAGIGVFSVGIVTTIIIYKLTHSESLEEFENIMQMAYKDVRTKDDLLFLIYSIRDLLANRMNNSDSRTALLSNFNEMVSEVNRQLDCGELSEENRMRYLARVRENIRNNVHSSDSWHKNKSKSSRSIHITEQDVRFLAHLHTCGYDFGDILTVANVPYDKVVAPAICSLSVKIANMLNRDAISMADCINDVERALRNLGSGVHCARAFELIQDVLPNVMNGPHFVRRVRYAQVQRERALQPPQSEEQSRQEAIDYDRRFIQETLEGSADGRCFGDNFDAWDIVQQVRHGRGADCVDKFVDSFNVANRNTDFGTGKRLLLNRNFLNMRRVLEWRNVPLDTITDYARRQHSGRFSVDSVKDWSIATFGVWFDNIRGYRNENSNAGTGRLIKDFISDHYDTMREYDERAYNNYLRFVFEFDRLASSAGFGDSNMFQIIQRYGLDHDGNLSGCNEYTVLTGDQKRIYNLWDTLCNSLSQMVTSNCYNQVCNQIANASLVLDSFYDNPDNEDDVRNGFSTSLFSDFADASMNFLIDSNRSNAYNAEREKSIKYVLRSLVNVTPNTDVYFNFDSRQELKSCFDAELSADKAQTMTAEFVRALTFQSLYDYVRNYDFSHLFKRSTMEAVCQCELGVRELNALDAMSGGELKRQLADFINEYNRADDIDNDVRNVIRPLVNWCNGGRIRIENLRPLYNLLGIEADSLFDLSDGTTVADNLAGRFSAIHKFIISLVPEITGENHVDPTTGNFSAMFVLDLIHRGLIGCTD